LTIACLDNVAHDDFVHEVRIDARAFNRGPRGDHSQIDRAEIFESAKKLPYRCPGA
jgi:hypothetical protein